MRRLVVPLGLTLFACSSKQTENSTKSVPASPPPAAVVPKPKPVPAKKWERRYAIASMVNVRKSATSTATILKKVRIATPVELLEGDEDWAEVKAGRTRGFASRALFEEARPSVDTLIDQHDAADPKDTAERRKWAERATALDPASVPALERLVAVLEEVKDLKALALAREGLAVLKGSELVAATGGAFKLSTKEPKNAQYGITSVATTRDRIWVSTMTGLLTRTHKKNEWRLLWGTDGKLISAVFEVAYRHPYLWAASRFGVYRIDPKRRQYAVLTKESGLKSSDVRAVTTSETSVWVAYEDAAFLTELAFDGKVLRHVALPRSTQRIVIKRLFAEGNVVFAASNTSLYEVRGDRERAVAVVLPGFDPPPGSQHFHAEGDYVHLTTGESSFTYEKKTAAWRAGRRPYGMAHGGRHLYWVGSSYDIGSASYFVLRYLKDANTAWKNGFLFLPHTLMVPTSIAVAGPTVWLANQRYLIEWRRGRKTAWVHEPFPNYPVKSKKLKLTDLEYLPKQKMPYLGIEGQ